MINYVSPVNDEINFHLSFIFNWNYNLYNINKITNK
jgi:hypothetical protein